MQIILSKFLDKPATISCIRDDGSVTWQNYGKQGGFFPIHDLTHFIVETELGYTYAFFGMIAKGRDLNDFGPGDSATFHPEAVWAEMLAGLLTAVEGRGSSLNYGEITETLDSKAHDAGIPPIALTEDQLLTIRKRIQEMADVWEKLPAGEKLVIPFHE